MRHAFAVIGWLCNPCSHDLALELSTATEFTAVHALGIHHHQRSTPLLLVPLLSDSLPLLLVLRRRCACNDSVRHEASATCCAGMIKCLWSRHHCCSQHAALHPANPSSPKASKCG